MSRSALLLGLLLLASVTPANDLSWRRDPAPPAEVEPQYTRTSFYVPMRDGVQIAVDLYLPPGAGAGARVPAILRMTRYWRAVNFRWLTKPFLEGPQPLAARFIAQGYAWLDVDVRGSGASGGVQRTLWSDEEVADGGELVDWIVSQPWSSGKVGALGDSYDGTAAELLLSTGRPAVRAVAPRFALFDGYSDIGFPGGVRLAWFTKAWSEFNDAIDRGHLWSAFPWWVPLAISGPRPIDGPDGESGIAAAQAAHEANFEVDRAAQGVEFRDDLPEGGPDSKPEHWSPCCKRRAAIEASGAAILSVSGWWDGAYQRAAIERFRTLRNPQKLLIGPWNHGGDQQLDPFEPTRATQFDHAAELLRFFDHYLKDAQNGWQDEPPVTYFTTGDGRWRQAPGWPPPAIRTTYYFAAQNRLSRGSPAAAAASDSYAVDPDTTTGTSTRWHALAVPTWTEYPDRVQADRKLLIYDSEPLAEDVEVTGHPVMHLALQADGSDAAVFVYLEDVALDGEVGYVTEGQFRALQRKLEPPDPETDLPNVPRHSFRRADAQPLVPGETATLDFDLLPTSHLFRQGHRIRIALAGADRDQFAPPANAAAHWQVMRSVGAASRVELPVVDRR